MVGSPPASAGDTGSIPGPGGSRMPQSNWAREPQLLGLHAAAAGARMPGARAQQHERPPR